MGLRLIFDDDGWPEIAGAFKATRQLSIIKITVMSAAVAAATGFVVYLFIGRKKKEYAVMRALGTTRKMSARALILPLLSVAIVSVLAGGTTAWIYTVRTIAHSNTLSLLNEATTPVAVIAVSLISAPDHAAAPIDTVGASIESVEHRRKSSVPGFVLRYIWKHMRRSAGKSALAVLLAVLLFVAIGQLALMKESYTRLCEETVIKANFVGGLQLGLVPQIKQSGYVKEPYYELTETVDLNSLSTDFVITNNIARYTSEEVTMTYADGYDASVMDKLGKNLIVGKALMEAYGLKPGDMVTITSDGLLAYLQRTHIADYRTNHPGDTVSDEDILTMYQGEINKAINHVKQMYIIAGVVTTASNMYDMTAFTPGDYDAYIGVGKPTTLEVVEFTLADNERVDKFRSYGEKAANGAGVTFVMDTSKLEHLRNTLRLLETMYPIALTAALLIGGFLCCLVIFQSSKEAAIMRIQGTTKRRTRTLLALEQVILSFTGLVIGALGLLLYKGPSLAGVSSQLVLFAALYFVVILIAAVICSAQATRRNVLELLQTKE